MGVQNVPLNRMSRGRPLIRPLRLSSMAVVLAVTVIAAFWVGFIWLAALNYDDARDDAGDNLKAFAESYAEFAATLAHSGFEIPLGERMPGITPASTRAAAALDSYHAVAQPDEAMKVTIRRLTPGSEGSGSQYITNQVRQYRYIDNQLFAAAQRPDAGIEILAEETGVIEAVEDWRDAAIVEILVLGALTAMMASFAVWFVGHLRAHEAMGEQNAKLQSKLRQAEKMQAIGTLAGGVAHELNNLLQPIIMMTELVLTELPEGEHKRHAAPSRRRRGHQGRRDRSAHPGVRSGGRGVAHSSRYGRCRARRLLVHPHDSPSSITLHVEIDNAVMIRGDKTQLTQVLINLATNARDAIGANVGTIWVSLSKANVEEGAPHSAVGTLTPGAHAVLTVRDTGSGMTKATVDRIFEPFFTTKGVGKGTGLGLSVTHGIIVGHGGAIQVDSAPGRGTSFSIYLPTAGSEIPIALAS